MNGYWKELVAFTRNLFNNTFKTNPYLERAVMTGITRVSKESMFSDLNNLKVITMTSNKYASYFGFTEPEIFAAMDEFGLTNKGEVKFWYDGFTIGNLRDIYNPWSIISFLDEQNMDLEAMNEYMNRFALNTISYFDVGGRPSEQMEPERFYHGFVLGLLVDLKDWYEVISNRESGFGRYDVMLRTLNETDDAIILEFKVYNPRKERDLEETVQMALQQIEDKRYEQILLDQGISRDRIRKYGFAFRGKEVLIGE